MEINFAPAIPFADFQGITQAAQLCVSKPGFHISPVGGILIIIGIIGVVAFIYSVITENNHFKFLLSNTQLKAPKKAD